MDKMDGRSLDILQENITKMKQLFPDILSEEKIDFEKLKEILGDYLEEKEEKYSFTWNGKSRALRLSQTPSTGTLRPAKDESKNWDTTGNLYIEGDNLEVLKLLQKSYHGKVKMIYIDPPYNTGKDFVYPDDYRDNIKNYLELTGQVDDEGKKIGTNSEASGRYHTDWLNMMYPRLRLARNLLCDDGVIFISIDDNEVQNLRKICDEVFGEDSGLTPIIWLKGNAQNDAHNIQSNHEYLLIYIKNTTTLRHKYLERKELLVDDYGYYYKGSGLTTGGEGGTLNARPNLGYTIYYNPSTKDRIAVDDYDKDKARSNNSENIVYRTDLNLVNKGYLTIRAPKKGNLLGCWTWSKDKFNESKHLIMIVDGRNGYSIYKKNYVDKEMVKVDEMGNYFAEIIKETPPNSFVDISSSTGTKSFNELLDNKIFNNPKPVELIGKLCNLMNMDNSYVLDFFAGSSTTAHSVMKLNAEDGGNRKFIMVQLPEPTEEKTEAYKAGYKTIAEIGKERIRRAGEKIIEENKDKDGIENLDIGFKVFKLDSSNIKEWNPDYDDLQFSLEDMLENFVPDRTEDDILYEIMLKYGIDLTVPIDKYDMGGKKVYSIGFGILIVCLDKDINIDVVEGIIKKVEELDPEKKPRVVFRDLGFKDDTIKTNALLTLKRYGIEEVVSI